jgi:hypothetical protein
MPWAGFNAAAHSPCVTSHFPFVVRHWAWLCSEVQPCPGFGDRIWPKDFAAFCKRVWRTDAEYRDVQRYGGILLIGPLIGEFGVRRTLAYLAAAARDSAHASIGGLS